MLEEYLARKKRRKTIGCFVVPLVALLLLGGAFFAFRIYCSGRVQAELDAIAEAGYPVTLEALNAWYPQPMGENAADVYLAAFGKYMEPPWNPTPNLPIVGGGKLPAAGEPLPEEMREAIKQYLEANREALELLHEVAGIDECRYPLDMTDGFVLPLPHLEKTRDGARLLRLEALHHSHRGEGDHAASLKIMREAIEASEKPFTERLQAMRAVDAPYRVRRLPGYCVVTKMLMPAFDQAIQRDVVNVARVRAARTALAVERYRRTSGPLPEKLDDLVPKLMDAIPIDPFDGKPLRYKKLEKGYVVYSVGPDGDDDGGKERGTKGGDDYDVTFTVER